MDFTWPMVTLPVGGETFATLRQDWRVDVLGVSYCVPNGTRTDGASIPRMLWRVCGHPLQSPRVYAALVHDWLYSADGPGVTRAEADSVYRELLIRFGWGKTRAWVEWAALRVFGATHYEGEGR